MYQMNWWQDVIALVAVACAVLSFLIYFLFSLGVLKPPADAAAEDNARAAAQHVANLVEPPTPSQVAEMIKALGTLSQALVKAGPALWSLLSAALFLLVACLAAGTMSAGSGGALDNDSDSGQENPADNSSKPAENGVATGIINKQLNPADFKGGPHAKN